MVIFLSFGEGMRRVFSEQLGAVGPDLQVTFGEAESFSPFSSVPELDVAYVGRLQEVAEHYGITAVTPTILLFRGGFDPRSSLLFQGLPADIDPREFVAGFRLLRGRWFEEGEEGSQLAVIGQSAAERLGLGPDRELRLNPRSSFRIIGVASSDAGVIDNSVIVPLDALRKAMGVEGRVSALSLDLAQPALAADAARRLSAEFPELGFQTRSDLLDVVEQGLRISDAVRLGISAIALLVGAIAVVNTLLMSVFERTREFGVLRAVGARPRFLLGLVLTESVLLSIAGALAGLVLGRLGISAINQVSESYVGLEVAALTVRLAGFAVAVALTTGLLAGLLPAARAARIPIATAMARE